VEGIRIVSDGTTFGTKVYDEQGNLMKMVSKIEIEPLDANQSDGFLVKAKLTCLKVRLDLKGQAVIEQKNIGGEQK
jgi:hypothetical protein